MTMNHADFVKKMSNCKVNNEIHLGRLSQTIYDFLNEGSLAKESLPLNSTDSLYSNMKKLQAIVESQQASVEKTKQALVVLSNNLQSLKSTLTEQINAVSHKVNQIQVVDVEITDDLEVEESTQDSKNKTIKIKKN